MESSQFVAPKAAFHGGGGKLVEFRTVIQKEDRRTLRFFVRWRFANLKGDRFAQRRGRMILIWRGFGGLESMANSNIPSQIRSQIFHVLQTNSLLVHDDGRVVDVGGQSMLRR